MSKDASIGKAETLLRRQAPLITWEVRSVICFLSVKGSKALIFIVRFVQFMDKILWAMEWLGNGFKHLKMTAQMCMMTNREEDLQSLPTICCRKLTKQWKKADTMQKLVRYNKCLNIGGNYIILSRLKYRLSYKNRIVKNSLFVFIYYKTILVLFKNTPHIIIMANFSELGFEFHMKMIETSISS